MTRITKAIAVLMTGTLIGVTGVGCSKMTEPWKDAPQSNVRNEDPAEIITNADGFSNVSTKCDHGNRIYVAYHGDNMYAAIAVVPQDPTCTR